MLGLDQRARRAGADLALVEGEHREALERLVVEVVAGAATSAKKMFGLLPPSSSVTGIRFWLAYCMIRRPVVVSPVKAILAIRLEEASGLPASTPKPLTTLTTPGGQQVGDQLDDLQDRPRGLLGRLDDHAVAGGQRGRQLPDGHQDREVPRDDLAHDAQRLVEVVGDGVRRRSRRCRPPGPGSRRRSSGSGPRPAAGPRPGSPGPACRSPRSRRPRASPGWLRCGRRSCSGCRRARRRRSGPSCAWRRARRPARARCPRRWSGRSR